MDRELKHSKYAETQKKAVEVLVENGPLTATELQDRLDVCDEKMQAVMRGLHDNGLVTSSLRADGFRYYRSRDAGYTDPNTSGLRSGKGSSFLSKLFGDF